MECKLCNLGVLADSLKSDLSIGKVTVGEIAKKYDVSEAVVKEHIKNHTQLMTVSQIRTDTNNFEEFYIRTIDLMLGLEKWVKEVITDTDEINDYRIRQLTNLTKEYSRTIELALKMEQYRDQSGLGDDLKWKSRYEDLINFIRQYGCPACQELLMEAV